MLRFGRYWVFELSENQAPHIYNIDMVIKPNENNFVVKTRICKPAFVDYDPAMVLIEVVGGDAANLGLDAAGWDRKTHVR